MAQAQLHPLGLWLELEKVGKDISLPLEINSEEKYKLFLAQTITSKQYHEFLKRYLWVLEEEDEEDVTSVTNLTTLVTKITNHLQILHPGNIQGFEKVKQFYCHTIRYIWFISSNA